MDAVFILPITHEPVPCGYSFVLVELGDLLGGHSGTDIHEGRANAHKLMARALRMLADELPMLLVKLTGGDKRNAIARDATALVAVDKCCVARAIALIERQRKIFAHEYSGIEPQISLSVKPLESDCRRALSRDSLDRLLALILVMPDGVQAMHGKFPEVVETSCNLGDIRQEDDRFYLCSLIRSFYETKKLLVAEQMRQLAALAGATFSAAGGYPSWEPNAKSELLIRLTRAYESAFPNSGALGLPRTVSIHAGLECGFFTEKYPGMDMISFGPTITGAHSPDETLDIASAEKTAALLLTVLAQMSDSL